MSDPIEITIVDGVATTIEPKLVGIADSADDADLALEYLQGRLGETAAAALSTETAATALQQTLGTTTISAKDFAAALAATGNDLRAISPEMFETAASTEAAAVSLRGYTQAQIDLFKAQQAGKIFMEDLNASFALTGKAARDSAAAFVEQATAAETANTALRGYTRAQLDLLKAEQDGAAFLADLNESFGLNATITKSAADSAAVFTAAMAEETAAIATTTGALVEQEGAVTKTTGVWGGLIGILAAFFAVGEVVKGIDNYTKLENAITLAGLSGDKAATQFDFLTKLAEDNGVAIGSVTSLYTKLIVVQSQLGLSSNGLNTLVTALTESFRIQGLGSAQVTQTLRDFSDILEGNNTNLTRYINNLQRADPALFNSVLKTLGVSAGQLTAELKDGTLSVAGFAQAVIDAAPTIQKLADVTHLTVSGSLNDLGTAFTKLVGDAQNSTGAIYLVALAIQTLAENLPAVATAVIIFGTAWLAFKTYGIAEYFVVYMIPAIIAFTAAMIPAVIEILAAAAPLLVLTAIAVGLGAALLALTGQTDNFVQSIKGIAGQIVDALGLSKIPDALKGVTGSLDTAAGSFLGLGSAAASGGTEATKATSATAGAVNSLNAALGITTTTANTNVVSVQHVSQMMQAVYDAAQQATGSVADLNDNLATTITRSDGTTASLVKFTDAQIAADTSINNTNSALQTQADRLAVLASRQAANPSLFNDPGNDNGNFPTLPTQTSFPDVTGFATGGSFVVGGRGGVDTNQVRFNATAGERVDILTPEQQRAQEKSLAGGARTANVNISIYAQDHNSFRRSRAQVGRQIGDAITAGMANG